MSKENFETALEELKTVVKDLESGELNLEDALKSFENGVKLTRFCQKELDAAQKKVEILTEANLQTGEVETREFDDG